MHTYHRLLVGGLLVAAAGAAGSGAAAVYNVADVAAFQAALTSAAGNGESDTVNLAAGTYAVGAPLSFASAEGFDLVITGAGIGATVLDGGGAGQVLVVDAQADGADVTVANLTLRNGSAAGVNGGCLAISTGLGDQTLSAVEVTGCAVTGANDVGGGAALVTGGGDVTVSGSRASLNTSSANVGGLFLATTSGRLELTNTQLTGNAVTNTAGSEYYGDAGGAQLYGDSGSTTLVEGCSFAGNRASGGSNPDGGGLMVYQLGAGVATTVRGNLFSANQAELNGGGLIVMVNASGSVTCDDNTFTGNTAVGGDGGAVKVHLDTGTLSLSGNQVTGNSAGGVGGGLHVEHTAGTATLADNRLASNHAAGNGGGLSLFVDSAAATVTGTTFWDNTVGNVGAGLSYAATTGSLTLDRCSFVANDAGSGAGGGFYLYLDQAAAATALRNLIVWQNLPDQVAADGGSGPATFTVTYSDVEGGTGAAWFGSGSIDADPLLVDAVGGDLHLASAASPAVDSGDPASTPDPDGSRADMGALPWDHVQLFSDGFESGGATAWSTTLP